MGKVENPGLNSSQGWDEEKNKDRIINKRGKKRKPIAYSLFMCQDEDENREPKFSFVLDNASDEQTKP